MKAVRNIPHYRFAGIMGVLYLSLMSGNGNSLIEFVRHANPCGDDWLAGEQFRSVCFWLGSEGE